MTSPDPQSGSPPHVPEQPTLSATQGSTMAISADERGTHSGSLREGPGTRIGPYTLVHLLGEGGFGSVFLAEQEKPVKRRVALKIVKLGMDTRQVVARFEQERQALAILDHANIAKVFDAGATETGRPFFVMELCTGEPLDTYCDKRRLPIRERLELFTQVCLAVQHAHTKGLIHRDIKPSNVLVTDQDGVAHVKVIDFGIAKATASSLTERSVFTEQRQFIGTPEYMSPEQAAGDVDIDTRTDIYALGVMLYQLLAGSTPFSGRELRSAAYAEIQRIIREVDPPRPSTRLSQSAEAAADIAACRQTEARRLGTIIRGDLDWIVMKCLEKERSRRYETAKGLANDVLRHLAGEPVSAAPPSAAYRMRKFVRRRRGTVAAAAAIAASLIAGAGAFAWQAKVATEQRDRALTAETAEHKRADELQRVSDFQKEMLSQFDAAAAGIQLTEDVRAQFLTSLERAGVPEAERGARVEAFVDLWSRVNATDCAKEFINRAILKPSAAAIGPKFADQPLVAAGLRHVVATRAHELGLNEDALALEKQVLETRRALLGNDSLETLYAISNIGEYLRGLDRLKEARPYYLEALESYERVLGPGSAEALTSHHNLAVLCQQDSNDVACAEEHYRIALEGRKRILGEDHPDTLQTMSGWSMHLEERGKLDEAEALARDVVARRRRVCGVDDADTMTSVSNLGALLRRQGKMEESEACFREVLTSRRKRYGDVHPWTLQSIQNLGTVLDAQGHTKEAEALLREALESQRRFLGSDHSSTLITMGNLSMSLIGQNRLEEAEPLCRETLERRLRALGTDNPATLIAQNVMGFLMRRMKRDAEAGPYWEEALEISRRVNGPAHPDTLTYSHNLGTLMRDQRKPEEAMKFFREVVDVGGPALGATNPIVMSGTRNLAAMLVDQKKYGEAEQVLMRAEPEARKSSAPSAERALAALLRDLGACRTRLEKFPEAEATLTEAREIFVRTRGEPHAETRSCTQALADLFAAWDAKEPGKGYDVKGAEWKGKIPEEGKEKK